MWLFILRKNTERNDALKDAASARVHVCANRTIVCEECLISTELFTAVGYWGSRDTGIQGIHGPKGGGDVLSLVKRNQDICFLDTFGAFVV